MVTRPRTTLAEDYAQGLACAICGQSRLRVVHLERYPDYVTCDACNAAFVVEQGGERVMYGSIPEGFPNTRRLALNQWAWFEAVARWARQEREPPTSPVQETGQPTERVPEEPLPRALEEGPEGEPPPEEGAREPSPPRQEEAVPREEHKTPARPETAGAEPEKTPAPEPMTATPPVAHRKETQAPSSEEAEEPTPPEERETFLAHPRQTGGDSMEEEEATWEAGGAGPPLPEEASVGGVIEAGADEAGWSALELQEEAPEPTDVAPSRPEAEEPPAGAAQAERLLAEATAAGQPGPGEPPPGQRYRVALRAGPVRFPDDVCAHCLRSPVRGRLAVVADLPVGQEMTRRRTVTFQVPLCRACQRRAAARSEEEKAARLQAHLVALLIALLLVVSVLALGVVTASDPLTLGFFLLIVAALGYTAPALFLLSRTGGHLPPPEARYVRSTLIIPTEGRGLEVAFEWRNRGYAERFLEANRSQAVSGVVNVKDRLAGPPGRNGERTGDLAEEAER